MRIEYGPPGHKGVTQIMGLGADGVTTPTDPSRLVAGFAILTYLGGAAVGSNFAKNVAIGGLGAILLTRALKSGAVKSPLPAVEFPTLQGWG